MNEALRHAITAVGATAHRLQMGADNQADDADTREWCASLAADLRRAIGMLDTILKAKPCCICAAAPGAEHAGYCSESW